jgi:hypothetical protein
MKEPSVLKGLQIWAGLLAAPLAWGVAMQISQMLPYVDCAHQSHSTAIAVMAAVVVALIAAVLSWRGADSHAGGEGRRRFIGWVAGLTALVISFALALQLFASLVLNACDR